MADAPETSSIMNALQKHNLLALSARTWKSAAAGGYHMGEAVSAIIGYDLISHGLFPGFEYQ
jgi:hypothetical protein